MMDKRIELQARIIIDVIDKGELLRECPECSFLAEELQRESGFEDSRVCLFVAIGIAQFPAGRERQGVLHGHT